MRFRLFILISLCCIAPDVHSDNPLCGAYSSGQTNLLIKEDRTYQLIDNASELGEITSGRWFTLNDTLFLMYRTNTEYVLFEMSKEGFVLISHFIDPMMPDRLPSFTGTFTQVAAFHPNGQASMRLNYIDSNYSIYAVTYFDPAGNMDSIAHFKANLRHGPLWVFDKVTRAVTEHKTFEFGRRIEVNRRKW